MPLSWPPPRMATVDDIASWSRMAPHLAVLFAKVQEERRSRELAEAAAEWLAAWPGGDLDAKDEAGWSALQRAAAAGQAVAVAELLRRPSVEVNGVEPTKGQPALVLASRLCLETGRLKAASWPRKAWLQWGDFFEAPLGKKLGGRYA